MMAWLKNFLFGYSMPVSRPTRSRPLSRHRRSQNDLDAGNVEFQLPPAQRISPPWTFQIPASSHELERIKPTLLRQLFRDKDIGKSEGDRAYLARLIDFIGKEKLELPPFPDVAMQLDRVLKNAEVQMSKVVNIAEKDPALVQQVWKQATSAQFAVPPSSFRLAVARIGFDPLWQIAMRTCLYSPVFRAPGYQTAVDQVRVRGIVAGELASHLSPMLGGKAYLAGLLHEIGMLIIFKTAAPKGRKNPKPSPAYVTAIGNGNHCAIGVMVAHSWGLGSAVASGIGYYLEPRLAPPEHQELAMVVKAASIAAATAEAARQGVEFGGLQALSEMEGLSIDPARLLGMANEIYDGLAAQNN